MVAIRRTKRRSASATTTSLFLGCLWSARFVLMGVMAVSMLLVAQRAATNSTSSHNHDGGGGGGGVQPQSIQDALHNSVRKNTKLPPPKKPKKQQQSPALRRAEAAANEEGNEDPLANHHGNENKVPPTEHQNHHDVEKPDEHNLVVEHPDAAFHEKETDDVLIPNGNKQVNAAEAVMDVNGNEKMILEKHGTGPTRLGYVVDLREERLEAPFRSHPLPDDPRHVEEHVADLVHEKKVKACEYFHVETTAQGRRNMRHLIRPACRPDSDTVLIAYNSAHFPRTICGKLVEAGDAIKVEEDCHEPAHLLPQDHPPVSGRGMPPIRVRKYDPTTVYHANKDALQNLEWLDVPECPVACQFEKSVFPTVDAEGKTIKESYNVVGTLWKIMYTDHDPFYDEGAKVERTAYRQDTYYATTALTSSVPLSFYNANKYDLHKTRANAPTWQSMANKATYLVNSDCQAAGSRRHKWYAAMAASGLATEAYGSCENNVKVGPGESIDTTEGRIHLYGKNRIALAYEAGNEKDHLTHITWEALSSGAVLAFVGAANIGNLLPSPHAAISASAYNSWDKFAAAVQRVAENETLWNHHRSWLQDDAALADFDRRFNFTRVSPPCRLCQWAYAKQYGLGWNHEQQIVREPHIARTFCTSDGASLVTEPFAESWVQGTNAPSSDEAPSKGSCASLTSTATIELEHYTVVRDVVHHDGITDILIKSVTEKEATDDMPPLVFRINVGVKNSEGAYFRDTHTLVTNLVRTPLVSSASIQDIKSKVTVLADWDGAAIQSPREGILDVVVQGGHAVVAPPDEEDTPAHRRIRIITEDVSELHDKMTEYYPSSFAKVMIEDFVDPIEFFYADPSASP